MRRTNTVNTVNNGGFGAWIVAILIFILYILLYFLGTVVSLALIGFTIYFFVAAAGLVPPLDFVPLIPFI